MRSIALALLFLSACVPSRLALEPRWRPLEELVANPAIPVDVYRTYGTTCETHDLSDFVALTPAEQDSLLAHEALHAARQAATPGGPAAYTARYNYDPDFMASEEMLGWSAEIQYAVRHGAVVDVGKVASFMSTTYVQGPGSPNPGRPVFDYDIVTAWIVAQVRAAGGTK